MAVSVEMLLTALTGIELGGVTAVTVVGAPVEIKRLNLCSSDWCCWTRHR